MSVTNKSILTMTYPKSGSLPRRVRAVANTPKGDSSKARSLILDPRLYGVYETGQSWGSIEQLHALAAWQLATQLAWMLGEENDLIPAKIHRVRVVGKGEDVTMWTLKETNTSAKEMLSSTLANMRAKDNDNALDVCVSMYHDRNNRSK